MATRSHKYVTGRASTKTSLSGSMRESAQKTIQDDRLESGGGRGGEGRVRKKTAVVERDVMFGMAPGQTTDSFCCCLTRFFLLVVGVGGAAVFALFLGLHFVGGDGVRRRVAAATRTDEPYLWYASVTICAVMVAVHLMLSAGAVLENSGLVRAYICAGTLFTLVFLVLVAALVALLAGAANSEALREECAKRLAGVDEEARRQCSDPAALRDVALLFGLAVMLPTLVIYALLMTASCNYAQALEIAGH